MRISPIRLLGPAAVFLAVAQVALGQSARSYFPPRGEWQTRSAAAVDLDSAKLQAAVDYALSHGSSWDFDRDQVRTFGPPNY